MAVSSGNGTQLPTAEGDELTWWRLRGDGSAVIIERIGGVRLAQPLSDYQVLEQTRNGNPAQRAGIRNHKVMINSLLTIAEEGEKKSRLLLHPEIIIIITRRTVLLTYTNPSNNISSRGSLYSRLYPDTSL